MKRIPVKSLLLYLNLEILFQVQFDSITSEKQYHKLMIEANKKKSIYKFIEKFQINPYSGNI